MIIKNTIYPKTKRIGKERQTVQITEKIDVSNLCLFKHNDELYIAQRNNIFSFKDFLNNKDEFKRIIYKGLGKFLEENGKDIEEKLYPESAICGEWIGMGKIKYLNRFDKRFLLFAKARVVKTNDIFSLENFVFDTDLIHWALGEQLPEYIGLIPLVAIREKYPSIDELDELYEIYTDNIDTNVEGFVVLYQGDIKKYVRFKNGRLEEHRG